MPPTPTVESVTEYLDETSGDDAPTVEIAMGGALLRVRIPGSPPPNQGQNRRGTIKRFSASSRRRLMQRLASIDRRQVRKLPLFITLTYPATWPDNMRECKRHLDTFLKRMRRSYAKFAAIWKLEAQERGAPHFHLLVWGVEWIPYQQVAVAWYEIVGSGLKEHLTAGTEVTRVRSWQGVAWYAAKYLAKVGGEAEWESPGRYWGVCNSAALPVAVLVRVVAWATAYRLRRVLWRRAQGGGYKTGRRGRFIGVTTFMDSGPALALLNGTT